jgi:urease accessory protein
MSTAATLLLADARFPAGGHAHSGGVEPAAAAGTVTGLASLELFLRGRLRTAGLTAAGITAAACARARAIQAVTTIRAEQAGRDERDFWATLDAETDARVPSPAQREASRRQGRALLRAARTAWPAAHWLNDLGRQPHHPVVLGVAAAAAGCSPVEAARIAAYQAVAGPASAAIRLLGLDPIAATAILASLAGAVDVAADQAARCADGPLECLPYPTAPALDLLAQAHIRAEVRLFES